MVSKQYLLSPNLWGWCLQKTTPKAPPNDVHWSNQQNRGNDLTWDMY